MGFTSAAGVAGDGGAGALAASMPRLSGGSAITGGSRSGDGNELPSSTSPELPVLAKSTSGSTPKMYRAIAVRSKVRLVVCLLACFREKFGGDNYTIIPVTPYDINRTQFRWKCSPTDHNYYFIKPNRWGRTRCDPASDADDKMQLLFVLPCALGFAPGLVPRTAGVEQRSAVVAMAAKRVALGIVGPGLVGGEVMAQIEATGALLEKQGLEVVMAAVSELKPDADGKLQGWQICSDTSLTISDFKAALADPAAGEPGDFGKFADHLTVSQPTHLHHAMHPPALSQASGASASPLPPLLPLSPAS